MAPQFSLPTESDLKSLTEDERLIQAGEAAKAASAAQGMVESLRSKAALLTDPKERSRVLSEMYDREIEAKGHSRKAAILKSGTFQGGMGGLGIGAATGAGLGTLVGTLTGTILTIPTSLVGGLVGMGTGMIHGPWITFGGKGEDGKEGKEVKIPKEAVDMGAVQIDQKTGQVRVTDAEGLEKATMEAEMKEAEQKKKELASGSAGGTGAKRKPKKLEIRGSKNKENGGGGGDGGGGGQNSAPDPTKNAVVNDASKPRKKPAKLEVRSKKSG